MAIPSTPHIATVISQIDWKLLAQQKTMLASIAYNQSPMGQAVDGILSLIDNLQDAAVLDGYDSLTVFAVDPADEEAAEYTSYNDYLMRAAAYDNLKGKP